MDRVTSRSSFMLEFAGPRAGAVRYVDEEEYNLEALRREHRLPAKKSEGGPGAPSPGPHSPGTPPSVRDLLNCVAFIHNRLCE